MLSHRRLVALFADVEMPLLKHVLLLERLLDIAQQLNHLLAFVRRAEVKFAPAHGGIGDNFRRKPHHRTDQFFSLLTR